MEITARWDELWQHRGNAQALAALRDELQHELARGPDDNVAFAIQWRLSRLEHFAGQENSADNAARHFRQGIEWARQSLRIPLWHQESSGVEGHLWLGANLLELAIHADLLRRQSMWREADAHLDRAVLLDEGYYHAAPLRTWGRVTHLRPLLLGGSLEKAMVLYQRALELFPGNSTTLLFYAQALEADRQRRRAIHLLQELLAAPDDAAWLPEQARDRIAARQLLQRLEAT